MSSTNDPPIVITGGSVTVHFDTITLQSDGNGKHHHPGKKIQRIVVKGGGLNINRKIPNGKVTIKVYYG
jgi:CRISPR/Cas system-associated endonuclease Cas1